MNDLPYEFGKVYLGNCIDPMARLPNDSVHALIMDPPYGSGNTHMRAQNIVADTEIENDDEDLWMDLMPRVFAEASRILDPKESAICVFGEGGGPKRISNRIGDWLACYLEFDTTLVWNKTIPGMGWTYRRSHEFIFIGHKKKSKLRWFDKSGAVTTVIHIPRIVNAEEGSHPTPKPIPLMEFLIRNHTKRGDIVCDPFSGGGSTGAACIKLGRQFVGFEIDPKWVEYSNKRLAPEREQLGLFGR